MNSQRVFKSKRRVRVGDCDENGIVRVDAIARYLQDIGYDDTDDIGVGDGGFWVARSISMELPKEELLPRRNEFIELETFCGGIGRAFAQRKVTIKAKSDAEIETLTTWVSIDESGMPVAVPDWLIMAYPNAQKTKATRELEVLDLKNPFEGKIISWPLRASDFDINGHANNAVAFDALYECARLLGASLPISVRVEYYNPLIVGQDTSLYITSTINGFDSWLVSDTNVSAAMQWKCN
jgi:acyl-ACP thioesterase